MPTGINHAIAKNSGSKMVQFTNFGYLRNTLSKIRTLCDPLLTVAIKTDLKCVFSSDYIKNVVGHNDLACMFFSMLFSTAI